MDDEPKRPTASTRIDSPHWRRVATPAPAPPTSSAFDRRTERFAIGEELGRGGMGRVVAATDTALDRPVAIKQALSDDDAQLARFEREVRITARLGHPSIVPVFDAGRDEAGRPFYVMRHIEGEPLGDRIDAAADLRARLTFLPNMLAAIDAAAFAHAQRVIHRDIKPWNILVGSYGETLLIDWGLARELDDADVPAAAHADDESALTRAGQAYGTPGFMAPEQTRGEPADTRADVYALGATLFHLLTGVVPLGGMAATAWITTVAAGTPPLREPLGPDVPPELAAIVGKAMAFAPAERYADAGELATDVRRFLAGQLVAAHQYTTRERIVKFVRRHRVAVLISAIATIAIAAIGTLAIARVLRERDRADLASQHAIERADQLLLDHAAYLVDTHPTRAVALVRQLGDDSKQWPRARDLVAAAAAHGIAHAVQSLKGLIRVLAFADDGRLLCAGEDQVIQIHELAAGTTHTLKVPVAVSEAIWLDGDRRIAFTGAHGGLYVVDVAGGTVATIDPTARIHGLSRATTPGHVWYVDDKQQLVESALVETVPPVVLADDAGAAVSSGDAVLIDNLTSLRIYTHGKLRQVETHATHYPNELQLAISAATDRIAAVDGDDSVAEWEISTGREVARWHVRSVSLYYAHDYLNSFDLDRGRHSIDALSKDGMIELLGGTWNVVWHTPAGVGDAFVTDTGTLYVGDSQGLHAISAGRIGTRVVAGRPGSPLVAVGSMEGLVMWWNIEAVAPSTTVKLPFNSTLCGFDERDVFVNDGTTAYMVNRTTGDTQELLRTHGLDRCEILRDTHLVLTHTLGAQGFGLTDAHTRQTEQVSRVMPTHDGMALIAEGPNVYERGADGVRTLRWVAPHPIDQLAAGGDVIAMMLDDGRLVRLQGAAAVTTAVAKLDSLGVDSSGAVWFSRGPELWRVDAGEPRLVATMKRRVADVGLGAFGIGVVLDDRSIWSVNAAGPVMQLPPAGYRDWMYGEHSMLVRDPLALLTVSFETGVTTTRQVTSVNSSLLGNHDRTLVTANYHHRAVIYEDVVPVEPNALRAWLDRATNAELDPDTQGISWR